MHAAHGPGLPRVAAPWQRALSERISACHRLQRDHRRDRDARRHSDERHLHATVLQILARRGRLLLRKVLFVRDPSVGVVVGCRLARLLHGLRLAPRQGGQDHRRPRGIPQHAARPRQGHIRADRRGLDVGPLDRALVHAVEDRHLPRLEEARRGELGQRLDRLAADPAPLLPALRLTSPGGGEEGHRGGPLPIDRGHRAGSIRAAQDPRLEGREGWLPLGDLVRLRRWRRHRLRDGGVRLRRLDG
mmetsp:Transcript_12533/g.35898  ORF Transcript_12533/g.35898 Transcript_12533/m.35898 type:complete len:246 (-) Transcript_12533:87-824(-)